jgi:hypothetical protein
VCPDNGSVSRYVFFNANAQDVNVQTAAKKVARSQGATVLKSLAGTMLLELTPAKAALVAQALPGWRYVIERKTTSVPERSPLERGKGRSAAPSTTAKR